MNRPDCSVDELELIALSDGELTENRARQLREHLQPGPSGCPDCAGRLARLEALAAQLRAPVPGASDPDFVDEVERRLPARRPRRATAGAPPRRRAGLAVSALASRRRSPWCWPRAGGTRRSSRPAGRPRPGTRWSRARSTSSPPPAARRPAGPTARRRRAPAPGDGIAVSARNGHRELPVYLMVFAVDARGEVHWIVPAWSDPAETPRSVRLAPGGELPEPAGRTPDAPAARQAPRDDPAVARPPRRARGGSGPAARPPPGPRRGPAPADGGGPDVASGPLRGMSIRRRPSEHLSPLGGGRGRRVCAPGEGAAHHLKRPPLTPPSPRCRGARANGQRSPSGRDVGISAYGGGAAGRAFMEACAPRGLRSARPRRPALLRVLACLDPREEAPTIQPPGDPAAGWPLDGPPPAARRPRR